MTTIVRVVCVGILISGFGVGALRAQAPAQTPVTPGFDVASVKPSDPNPTNGILGSIPSMRPQGRTGFAVSNMPFRMLVPMAYGVQDFQIIGGPSWQSNKFDIIAKAAEGTTQSTQELLPMMKTLLADRFKMKTHTETREMATYALVIARSDGKLGPDIKPSTSDCSNPAETQKRAEELAKGGGAGIFAALTKGETIPCTMMPALNPSNPGAGFGLRANGQQVSALTQMLTQATGRVVNDRTGLTGLYDWELRFDPQVFMAMLPQLGINLPGVGANAAATPSDSPSLLTALQEQLGLKLDSQKGPVEVLVIDSAELPQPD